MISFDVIFKSFLGKKDELIPILQTIQQQQGYLSRKDLLEVSKFTRVPESEVYGVVTFYSLFKFKPEGE